MRYLFKRSTTTIFPPSQPIIFSNLYILQRLSIHKGNSQWEGKDSLTFSFTPTDNFLISLTVLTYWFISFFLIHFFIPPSLLVFLSSCLSSFLLFLLNVYLSSTIFLASRLSTGDIEMKTLKFHIWEIQQRLQAMRQDWTETVIQERAHERGIFSSTSCRFHLAFAAIW